MLVLTRKTNDTILLGSDIKIQIIKIKGNTVRLGIDAPAHVKILRGELAPYGIEGAADQSAAAESNQASTTQQDYLPANAIEFDVNLEEDVNCLPNPFVVAHAS